MQTFEERIESLTKIAITSSSTPSQADVSEYLQDGVKDYLRKLITLGNAKALVPFTQISNVSDGNGLSVETTAVLNVLRGDGTIMNPATEIPAALKGRAADTDSIYYQSKYNPVFYQEGKKIYVLPTPTSGSVDNAEIHHVKFDADINHASVSISNFTKDSEYLIVLYAASMSCLSAATDIHNNPPTPPTYVTPNTTLSFTDVDAEFTDEDPEMIDKRLAKMDKQITEIENNITNAKNKYQEELDEYNKTLELNVNKYKWWMEQYVRLMSQYNSGIMGIANPTKSRKSKERREQK